MFTRIDHVMICVPDLNAGIEQFKKLGFNVYAGGNHPGKGTHNAIAFNQDEYIELLAIRDNAEYLAASQAGGLPGFVAAGGGLRYIAIQSDNLDADVAAMRSRGVDVNDAVANSRRTPGGQELKWKAATLGANNALPVFFIEHLTPVDERRKQVPLAGQHPNGATVIDRAYIVDHDADAAAAVYAKVFGVPKPALVKGTVIMSNMAPFQLGSTGLCVVTPYADGPAAEALKRRGPGPFQVLYRTTSMAAAARWTQEHGLPQLPRGVRNNGEHAMLATPDVACGAYVGFVGPE